MSASLERSTEDQQLALAQQQMMEEEGEEQGIQGNIGAAHPLDMLMVSGSASQILGKKTCVARGLPPWLAPEPVIYVWYKEVESVNILDQLQHAWCGELTATCTLCLLSFDCHFSSPHLIAGVWHQAERP
eukprot:1142275-Pelagomonas_calceolata.AAC.9